MSHKKLDKYFIIICFEIRVSFVGHVEHGSFQFSTEVGGLLSPPPKNDLPRADV